MLNKLTSIIVSLALIALICSTIWFFWLWTNAKVIAWDWEREAKSRECPIKTCRPCEIFSTSTPEIYPPEAYELEEISNPDGFSQIYEEPIKEPECIRYDWFFENKICVKYYGK